MRPLLQADATSAEQGPTTRSRCRVAALSMRPLLQARLVQKTPARARHPSSQAPFHRRPGARSGLPRSGSGSLRPATEPRLPRHPRVSFGPADADPAPAGLSGSSQPHPGSDGDTGASSPAASQHAASEPFFAPPGSGQRLRAFASARVPCGVADTLLARSGSVSGALVSRLADSRDRSPDTRTHPVMPRCRPPRAATPPAQERQLRPVSITVHSAHDTRPTDPHAGSKGSRSKNTPLLRDEDQEITWSTSAEPYRSTFGEC